jgi:sugar O-acyltransferase (sialic acid O-acetyltransferase NeuD family)
MQDRIVIVGAGGFGREVLDVIERIQIEKGSPECLGFLVDREYGAPGTVVNGLPILGGPEWLAENGNGVRVICAIAAPHLRLPMVRRLVELGAAFCTLIHPDAVITRRVSVGDGSIIAAGCVITNNVTIGRHVHLNLSCTIGHDVVVDDFVTLSPGCHVSGNVRIGQGAFVGTGANFLEKLGIGEWSRVGAGAAVTVDVEPNTTVVGVPGRVAKRLPSGWHVK